jgi:GNAT superfamily N-acetyltransferase
LPSVRQAGSGDAARLALVAKATFLETFAGLLDGADILAHCKREHDEAACWKWLADPDAQLWLAETEQGGAPIGFALLARPSLPIPTGERDLELKRIYLFSRFHGSGGGKALFEAALVEARRRGSKRLLLGVNAGNERARAFYAKIGFQAGR